MIFKPAARYPADPRAVFILALSVISGVTAIILQEAPDSLREIMPEWAVIIWGGMLTFGSLTTLIGMWFQSVNGIITEQIGSAMVSAATIFYSTVVFSLVGPSGIQTVGLILAWGLACGLRWFQLQILIRSGLKRAAHQEALRKLDAELTARRIADEKHNQGWWNK